MKNKKKTENEKEKLFKINRIIKRDCHKSRQNVKLKEFFEKYSYIPSQSE